MKLVKYFLQKESSHYLAVGIDIGRWAVLLYQNGKTGRRPFTIKQALITDSVSRSIPSEVQSQVTDVLEESIQSLGELYYLKTENRTGLSK